MGKIVRRRSLVIFVLLAYAFAWWVWPLYELDLAPSPIVGFGPFLAAVLVLGLTGGREAVRDLFSRMVHWRVGLRWYAMAIAAPLFITGLAAALNVLVGAPPPEREQLALWPSLLPAFFMLLLIPVNGAWEEPGWRGYLLPRLAAGRSHLAVAVIIFLVWSGWHLPLFLTGIIPWADLLFIAGTAILHNWIYYRADQSVLIVMIFHAMNNTVGQYFPALFSGAYVEQLALLQGEVCLVVALALLISQRRFWVARPPIRPVAAAQAAGD